VIGDGGVGKSSMIARYVDDKFSPEYVSTIGIDFKIKIIEAAGRKVKLQIWDTAGQERFHTITSAYYRGAHGLMIIFSLTDAQSFHHLQYWLRHIEEGVAGNVPKLLIGTKSDLHDKREVASEVAAALAEEMGMEYIEASSKEGKNVQKAFKRMTELGVGRGQEPDVPSRITLTSERISHIAAKKKCNC
jgi:Ras-related protein Rab-1A